MSSTKSRGEQHSVKPRRSTKSITITSKRKKIPRLVDLSEVIDFNSILEKFMLNGEVVEGISALKCEFEGAICLDSRPGFYFITGAPSIEEQCQWIRESLVSFPQPPNRTNHNVIYGPIEDLFLSDKEDKVLVPEERLDSDTKGTESNLSAPQWKFVEKSGESNGNNECKSVPASVLLRVPRIFTDADNAEISDLESQFAGEDDRSFLNYIRTSRININIRQVY